jgi:hypothetical protein
MPTGECIVKLEAVIVCVNYADFLAETLPYNLQHFDDVIVVTSHTDQETVRVCERNSVEHFKTDVFTEYGDPFNKGKAINLGLSNLKKRDWLLHIDADIVLPHRYRDMLRRSMLKADCIYGADRVNVYGFENWQSLKPRLNNHYQDNWFLDPDFIHEWNQPKPSGLRFGARVIHKELGWVPIGYHQLWHTSTGHRRYNFNLGSASGADVFFPAQWPRDKRVLLPEVIVYHLDSEAEHQKGTNWSGRKSRPFKPDLGGAAQKKTLK